MLKNNENSLLAVLAPMVLIGLVGVIRFTASYFTWQLNWFWLLVEFVFVVASGWFVISSDRNVAHKAVKLLWLVFIYIMTRVPDLNVGLLIDHVGAFVCFQTAELVLLDRKEITDNSRNFVKKYLKDWYMLGIIFFAWVVRSVILGIFGEDSMFVANAVAIVFLLFVVAFSMLGDDFWNKVLQGLLAVACLWFLFTGFADQILWYWGLLNLALKSTEIVSKIDLQKYVDSIVK